MFMPVIFYFLRLRNNSIAAVQSLFFLSVAWAFFIIIFNINFFFFTSVSFHAAAENDISLHKVCSEEMRTDWCQTMSCEAGSWAGLLRAVSALMPCTQRCGLQLPFVCLMASSPGTACFTPKRELHAIAVFTTAMLTQIHFYASENPFISKRYLFCLYPYL